MSLIEKVAFSVSMNSNAATGSCSSPRGRPTQTSQLGLLISRQPCTAPGVDLGLADPVADRLRRRSDSRANSFGVRPPSRTSRASSGLYSSDTADAYVTSLTPSRDPQGIRATRCQRNRVSSRQTTAAVGRDPSARSTTSVPEGRIPDGPSDERDPRARCRYLRRDRVGRRCHPSPLLWGHERTHGPRSSRIPG